MLNGFRVLFQSMCLNVERRSRISLLSHVNKEMSALHRSFEPASPADAVHSSPIACTSNYVGHTHIATLFPHVSTFADCEQDSR